MQETGVKTGLMAGSAELGGQQAPGTLSECWRHVGELWRPGEDSVPSSTEEDCPEAPGLGGSSKAQGFLGCIPPEGLW